METLFNIGFMYGIVGFGVVLGYLLLGKVVGKYVVAATVAAGVVLWSWDFRTSRWAEETRAVLEDFEKNFFLKIFWLLVTVIAMLALAGGIAYAVVRLVTMSICKIVKFCW